MIFSNPLLRQGLRVRLFNSLVLSILTYNMGTWRPLSGKEWSLYSGAIMSFYRSILRATHRHVDLQTWPHEQVLATLQVPSPEDLLAAARLRYFGSLWRTGPQEVWWLCHCEGKWFQGLQDAFDWLNRHTAGLHDKRKADLRARNWQDFASQPKIWKEYIKKATAHAVATNKADIYVKQWHNTFLSRAVSLGLNLPLDGLILRGLAEGAVSDGLQHGCVPCQITFKTKSAWAVHAYKVHHRIAPERYLLHGSACTICRREYHTSVRLFRHLQYSQHCAAVLCAQGVVGALRPGIGNTRCDQDRPLPLPVQDCEVSAEVHYEEPPILAHPPLRLQYCPTLLNALMQTMTTHAHGQDFAGALEESFQHIRQTYEDFSTIRKTIRKAWELCSHDEEQMLNYVLDDAFGRDLFQTLGQQATLEFFIPHQTLHITTKQFRGAAMDGLHAVRHAGFLWTACEEVPRPCTRHMIILHLFSGHRRAQDIPHYLADMCSPDGVHVTLVPVDIIFDPQRCDLSNKLVRDKWMFYAATGCVLGMIAGPPCETFTKARRLGGIAGLVDGDGGPRMIRSNCHPFGLPAMRSDEREHTHLSNVLLLFVHEMALELLAWEKRFFLKEHPAPPEEMTEDLPSSWDIGSTKILAAHPQVRLHTFAQGPLGAHSPKPTTFLLRGLETLENDLRRCSTHRMPAPLQMGKGADRTYNTAVLKAYPPQLCLAISDSVKKHLAAFNDKHEHNLTFEAMDDWVSAVLTNANEAAGMGADRAGSGA